MYIPQHFEVTDSEEIIAFIKAHSFGQLISTVQGRLFSSHIPFILACEGQSLICHLAKHNPQWENIESTENKEVLVTFQGPHDYVPLGPSKAKKPPFSISRLMPFNALTPWLYVFLNCE